MKYLIQFTKTKHRTNLLLFISYLRVNNVFNTNCYGVCNFNENKIAGYYHIIDGTNKYNPQIHARQTFGDETIFVGLNKPT